MHEQPRELHPELPHEPVDCPGDQDPDVASSHGHSHSRGKWVAGAVAVAGATAAALPFAYRKATGHWPLQGAHAEPVSVRVTLTVHRPPQEVYDFWRKLEQLPRFLRHVETVQILNDRRSRWTARSGTGKPVCWEAEITTDEPGRRLAWSSVEGSEIEQEGDLRFHDANGRGTRLEADLRLSPPGGRVGRAVASLLEPVTERQIREDLRRFKNLMEAGEVPTTEGQPHGHRATLEPTNPF